MVPWPVSGVTSVCRWGLDYVVLTSVDRDDVPDYGSDHIAQTIKYDQEIIGGDTILCFLSSSQGAEAREAESAGGVPLPRLRG